MTQEQRQLWERLSAFDIDDMGSKLRFSDRLARENGWTKQYTARVIEEYKRFLFLCCVQRQRRNTIGSSGSSVASTHDLYEVVLG